MVYPRHHGTGFASWQPNVQRTSPKYGVRSNPFIVPSSTPSASSARNPLQGLIEEDVEHFRPKTAVTPWTPPTDIEAALAAEGVTIVQPADGSKERGYKFLAYHPFNYAVACKPCNTVLKANYFPIAGRRKAARRPPARGTERPFLIYPIGDLDNDPENLISWRGCHPQPVSANGFDRLAGDGHD